MTRRGHEVRKLMFPLLKLAAYPCSTQCLGRALFNQDEHAIPASESSEGGDLHCRTRVLSTSRSDADMRTEPFDHLPSYRGRHLPGAGSTGSARLCVACRGPRSVDRESSDLSRRARLLSDKQSGFAQSRRWDSALHIDRALTARAASALSASRVNSRRRRPARPMPTSASSQPAAPSRSTMMSTEPAFVGSRHFTVNVYSN